MKNLSAVDSLVNDNLALVQHIARDWARPDTAAFDDLVSVGNEALLRAARTFDPARGIPFGSWASVVVRNALNSAARKAGNRRKHETAAGEAIAAAPDARGDEGDELEQAAVARLWASLVDRLASRERDLVRAVFGLTGLGETTRTDLARQLGLTKARVGQVVKAALAKLRDLGQEERLPAPFAA